MEHLESFDDRGRSITGCHSLVHVGAEVNFVRRTIRRQHDAVLFERVPDRREENLLSVVDVAINVKVETFVLRVRPHPRTELMAFDIVDTARVRSVIEPRVVERTRLDDSFSNLLELIINAEP